jgi:hypothetical protein
MGSWQNFVDVSPLRKFLASSQANLALWYQLSSFQNVPKGGKVSISLMNTRHVQPGWCNPTVPHSHNSVFSSINIFQPKRKFITYRLLLKYTIIVSILQAHD